MEQNVFVTHVLLLFCFITLVAHVPFCPDMTQIWMQETFHISSYSLCRKYKPLELVWTVRLMSLYAESTVLCLKLSPQWRVPWALCGRPVCCFGWVCFYTVVCRTMTACFWLKCCKEIRLWPHKIRESVLSVIFQMFYRMKYG